MNLNYLKRNKISVCIPTYNNIEGLLALLGSLQNQTIFKDLNILISDNGSIDNVESTIYEKFKIFKKNPSFEYVYHAKNYGSTWAYHYLTNRANGEFFCCLPSDTKVRPTYFEKLRNILKTDKDAVGAYSGFIALYNNGETKYHNDNYTMQSSNAHTRISNMVGKMDKGTALFGLYNTFNIKKVFQFSPAQCLNLWSSDRLHHLGDTQFLISLLTQGTIVQISDHLLERQLEDGSGSGLDRMDGFLNAERNCRGLSFIKGLDMIITNLYQETLKIEEIEKLDNLICNQIITAYQKEINKEIDFLLSTLEKDEWHLRYDSSKNEKSKKERSESTGKLESFFKSKILIEAIIARRYVKNEKLEKIIQLCEKTP
jgi:glycosyltransferase involved in cell wall biosynthesis